MVAISHVLEPRNPGVCQSIWNLGEFIDEEGIAAEKDAILASQARLGGHFQRCWRYLQACGCLLQESDSLLAPHIQRQRLEKLANRLLKKECPARGSVPGHITWIFLTAITPQGMVTHQQWLGSYRCYALRDRYGLTSLLLSHLMDGAVKKGWDVLACEDPLRPGQLRQLILPQQKLAFLFGEDLPCQPVRTLNLDRYVEPEGLTATRARRRFHQKLLDTLLKEALAALAEAKQEHDVLERCYTAHIRFDTLEVWQNALLQKLLRDGST